MESRDREPDFVAREERAAAAEAAAIGGGAQPPQQPDGDAPVDEAMRPVYEAGGGEAEGFELAEADLRRNAAHEDGGAFPERDRFSAENEADRAGAEYGEADGQPPRD